MRKRNAVTATLGATAVLVGIGMLASDARAFKALDNQWRDKTREFKINFVSFQTNLADIPLAAPVAEYWISFAMQLWRQRTPADIQLVYQGTTTKTFDQDDHDGTCRDTVTSGSNEIYMHPDCYLADPDCTALGVSADWVNSLDHTETVEDDVCFFYDAGFADDAQGWRVNTGSFQVGTEYHDLVSVMTHEFGHFLGLGHSNLANTLMTGNNVGSFDGTIFRYPYGDDMNGMRSTSLPYGGKNPAIFYRPISTGSWGSEVAALTSNVMPGVTLAKRDATNWGVSLAYGATGLAIARSNYAPPAALSFTFKAFPGAANSSRRPFAIAGKTEGTNFHLAAWSRTEDTAACNRIRIGISTDNFDTMTPVDLPSTDCTAQEPTLVYDPNSNRFVLFYVQQGTSASDFYRNDNIKYRTTTDGVNWTPATFIFNQKVQDSMSAACSDSQNECMLNFTRTTNNNSKPISTIFAFTVDSAGVLTVTDTSTNTSYTGSCRHWGETAGVYRRNGVSTWFAAASSSGCTYFDDAITTNFEATNPLAIPFSTLPIPSVLTRHRPAFAMADDPTTTTGYIFYAKE